MFKSQRRSVRTGHVETRQIVTETVDRQLEVNNCCLIFTESADEAAFLLPTSFHTMLMFSLLGSGLLMTYIVDLITP